MRNFKIGHLYSRGSPQRTNFERTLRCWADVFEILKIDNKPVFFKNYREAGITYTHDLLFDRDINVAFTHPSKKINKTNFLQWASLRHSIPSQLRFANVPLSTLSPSFTFENNTFDIREKRSKYYYSLHVSRKAQHPNITIKLQRDFDFTIDQINQIFLLPHSVALESYVKAFQYKVINSIFTQIPSYAVKLVTEATICVRFVILSQKPQIIFELFFCKKKYLLVGASGMLWTGQWVSESVSEWVRDVCMSHQSDWIYYKQPIKFLFLVTRGNLTLLFFTRE